MKYQISFSENEIERYKLLQNSVSLRKPRDTSSSVARRCRIYRLSRREGREREKIRVRDRADRRNPREWRDMRGRTVRNRR